MVKGKYVDLILEGKKKSTIRLGRWIPKYEEVTIHGGGRPFAIVKITRVVYKKVRELTEEDAKRDGLNGLDELLKELKGVYGRIDSEDVVTIMEFEVKKKLTELDVKDPYMGLEPVEIARLALRYIDNLSPEEEKVLKTLTRVKSLRETAIHLYGSIEARWRVRRVVKKALHDLVRRGVLGPRT
jgi:hypothetical protein